MEMSELKVFSIGIAAENLKLAADDGSINHRLEVVPIEASMMLNGELNSDQIEEILKAKDANGGEYQVKSKTANSVPATWLPLGGSNRFTPPNVRRGERIVLYRFADADKFYWATLFDDIQLRKLETVIYAWSGTQDESDQSITPNSHYFLEVSTHKGLVHFHTSKKNGEFTSYDLQINTKDGFIRIQDDIGNLFIFDSKEKQIAMKNADDCFIQINKKNAEINVPETLSIKAKNVIEEISEKISVKAGDSITEETKTFKVEGSSGAEIKSGGKIKITGVGVDISKKVSLK